jgi:hypothetical protein
MLPFVLTRVDDGERSARLIAGNGVSLVWAPQGPGWNWQQPWGGYPSWQSLALYGVPPIGLEDKPGYGRQGDENENIVFATAEDMLQTSLCSYLSADGSTLLDEPQHIWRMPTTDELVRSLGRHGENAGCQWQGNSPGRCSAASHPTKNRRCGQPTSRSFTTTQPTHTARIAAILWRSMEPLTPPTNWAATRATVTAASNNRNSFFSPDKHCISLSSIRRQKISDEDSH